MPTLNTNHILAFTTTAVLAVMAGIFLPFTSGCAYQPMGDPLAVCYQYNQRN